MINMEMSKVLTRIFLHPYMLFQPLFRRVCSVALITIKLWILHSENRNLRNQDCISQFLSIFCILSIHRFFRSVTNLHSYSGCSSPIPPPQSSSACSSSWVLMTSVNWFMGAVPRYWGCLTSIDRKHFPHMSHLKVTLGPG